jgi:hypothetical protein
VKTLTAAQLKAGSIPAALFGPMDDPTYFLFHEGYLLNEFLPAWAEYKLAAGIVYRKGRTDCDDFVRAFLGQIVVAAVRLDTDAAPAVGRVQVVNHAPTLGIAAGNHVLIVAAVDRGGEGASPHWLFIDPITDEHAWHENYPATISHVSV